MELNIVNEVAALQRLSVGQLRQRFVDLFGETTKASNRTWLTKRIVWRIQALAEGDLSERVRRRAAELARDADLRLNPPQNKANAATPPPEPVGMPAPIDHRVEMESGRFFDGVREQDRWKTTPAMKAELTDHPWTLLELLEAISKH